MLISAVADLDPLGIDLEPFWEALKLAKEPELFLLGGDIYEFRNPDVYGLVLDFLKLRKWKCPIVAIFGNREFDEDKDEIRSICKKRVRFLEEESVELKIGKRTVGIVGSEGSLDVPTWWQYSHVPGIKNIYDERREKVERLLKGMKTDVKILLTHYSPTYKTLKGEDKGLYTVLGSKKFEKVLMNTNVDFAIHGHAHYGIPLAFVESVPVFNVAFEISRKITEIDTDKLPKPGLFKFVK